MPMMLSTLLASAQRPAAESSIDDSNFAAAIASDPAGRACRSPASVIEASELAGMPRLLGRACHGFDVAAHGGCNRRGHCAFDKWRIGDGERLGHAVPFRHERPHG